MEGRLPVQLPGLGRSRRSRPALEGSSVALFSSGWERRLGVAVLGERESVGVRRRRPPTPTAADRRSGSPAPLPPGLTKGVDRRSACVEAGGQDGAVVALASAPSFSPRVRQLFPPALVTTLRVVLAEAVDVAGCCPDAAREVGTGLEHFFEVRLSGLPGKLSDFLPDQRATPARRSDRNPSLGTCPLRPVALESPRQEEAGLARRSPGAVSGQLAQRVWERGYHRRGGDGTICSDPD